MGGPHLSVYKGGAKENPPSLCPQDVTWQRCMRGTGVSGEGVPSVWMGEKAFPEGGLDPSGMRHLRGVWTHLEGGTVRPQALSGVSRARSQQCSPRLALRSGNRAGEEGGGWGAILATPGAARMGKRQLSHP